MGTTPTIKLVKGSYFLDLSQGTRYRVAKDFVPPSVSLTPSIVSGGSANKTGSASVVDVKANPQTFSFSIDVQGDTEAEVRRGISDLRAMLGRAGDDAEPLYLSYKPNSDTPEPTWGQDGTIRYVVLHASLAIGPSYGNARLRERYVAKNAVTLTIQPYAVGLPQVAATARGSVHQDNLAVGDGRDRGVIVCLPSTNACTNPIFGHPTWNTGWTAGANLTASKNTNKQYVLVGMRSAKLQAHGATRTYTQSLTLTAVTYTISFYAKRPDGGAIDANTCQAWFNSAARTSTYSALANGWYRVKYTGTGSAAAATYGVVLAAGITVYVDGFQVELTGYATPLAWGDLYGCAWSGTAHNSTTTRPVLAYLRLPLTSALYNSGTGSMRTVVTFTTVTAGTNMYCWYEAATGLRVYYDPSSSTWKMSDGTTTISGGSAASVGVPYMVHATWSPSGMALYVNGTSVATGAYAVSASLPTYLYFGTTSVPDSHCDQTLGGMVLWGQALTSGQVSADYTNASQISSAGMRLDTLPYLWTIDGDNVVDNYDDGGRNNWGVFAGIPGSAPADTEYTLQGEASGSYIALALWKTQEFMSPSRILYFDQGVAADASSSNNDYYRLSIGTTETNATMSSLAKPWATDPDLYRFLEDREWFAVVRARVAGTGKLRQKLVLSAASTISSKQWAQSPATYFRTVVIPSIYFPKLNTGTFAYPQVSHYITAKNTSAVNTDIDYYCMFPRPLAYIFAGGTTLLRGNRYASEYENPATFVYEESGTISDPLELEPDTYNVVMYARHGTNDGAADAPAGALAFTTTITPRYSLV